MKKILWILCVFMMCVNPIVAEEETENPIDTFLQEGDYWGLEAYFDLNPQEKELFFTQAPDDQWFAYLQLKKQSMDYPSMMNDLEDALSGFDSGAFKEGDGVDPDSSKYIYNEQTLLWEGKNSERSGRLNVLSGNFRLWAPQWGTFMGEPVGVEIICERLYTDTGWNYTFSSMGRPFELYLENANQSMITVRFYTHVDAEKKDVNGELLNLHTDFEYMMFGADGLTHEESTNEYIGSLNDSLPAYTTMAQDQWGGEEVNGRKVYYALHPGHNLRYAFNVKDLDEIKVIIGFTGSGNWKEGGDGTIYFSLTFDSFGLLKKGHVLRIEPNGGRYEGPLNVEGKQDDEIQLATVYKEGYSFIKWEPEQGTMDGNMYTFVDADDVVVAEWKPVIYDIHYELNGGNNHPANPASYTIEDEIHLGQPTREYYEFIGWQEGDSIPKGSVGEKTFTAEWKAVEYPITYILNGGTNDPDNPQSYTIEDHIFFNQAGDKERTFIGWDKDGQTIEEIVPYTQSGALILEAQWKKKNTCNPLDKNCDGIVSCEEQHGSGWIWSDDAGSCEYRGEYRVVNTSATILH